MSLLVFICRTRVLLPLILRNAAEQKARRVLTWSYKEVGPGTRRATSSAYKAVAIWLYTAHLKHMHRFNLLVYVVHCLIKV